MIQPWKVKHGLFIGCCKKNKLNSLTAVQKKAYTCWVMMKARCYSETSHLYPRYGGRGIRVCRRWRYDFMAFLSDMGTPKSMTFSIGRIDNDKGYSPENCRWESDAQQTRNRSNNIRVSIGGETLCLSEWARKTNLSPIAFLYRMKNWPKHRWLEKRQNKGPKPTRNDIR